MRVSPRFISGSLAVLILIFGWRCYRTFRVFTDTADEQGHITSGLEVWQDHRYRMELQHPPLVRVLVALPAYLAGLRQTWAEREMLHPTLWTGRDREFYWHTLSMARLGSLAFAPFLLLYVFLWGRQLYGPGAALGAVTLVSFSPNLLAHASLATLDFGPATTTFIAAYYLWRWSRQPGGRNCALAAVAFAVATITKFSALLFLPPIAVGFFLLAWREQPRRLPAGWRTVVQQVALFSGVASVVIWAGYGFDFGPLPPLKFSPIPRTFTQYLQSAVEVLAGQRSLPAPGFVRGVLDVLAHNSEGHTSYLLGRVNQFGWWYYFPVALAVKSTLPFLLLAITGLGVWMWNRGPAVYPLLAAGVVLGVCMSSRINIGIRHILAIYPFLALVAAGLFAAAGPGLAAARRLLWGLAVALTAWHIGESIAAHPDYLAYFNEIARGREEQFLLDSNLDWGQDLERLRRYLEANRISTIYMSCFGRIEGGVMRDIHTLPLPAGLLPVGWVAVSQNHLGGITRDRSELAWLKRHRPAARVGKSILVYHFSGHTS